MPRTENAYSALHRIGLQDIFEQYNTGMTSWHADIAPQKISTKQQFYRFVQSGDFGLAPIVSQAAPIGDDDIWFGNQTDIYPVKRGLGFSLSTEALETDQYGELEKVVPKLKLAFNKTREQAAANIINFATFTGQYQGPDKKALAATDHPLDNGTDSNLITDAFSPLSLEKIVANMKQTKSHRGDPDPIMGPFVLFVHPSQEYYAMRVVNSAQLADTANNDKNVIGGRISKIVASPYFTNATFFGIRDANAAVQPFACLERRGLRVKTQEDIDNDVMKYRLTEMYAYFSKGWRGYHHSTGAGS